MLIDSPGGSPAPPQSIEEQHAALTDAEKKISPMTFPVPTVSPDYVNSLASDLRTAGSSISETGNSITGAWTGLRECYSAPESETLYEVLDSVAVDGDEVGEATASAATALETFADNVESIKERWSSLRTEAYELLGRIEAEGDDWRKADGVKGFFGGKSGLVGENEALVTKGESIIDDYAEYETTCADAINKGIPGRTTFEKMPEGGADLDPNVFYHGYDQDLSELATEWGSAPAGTDHPWWVDAGSAVWDFGVGAVEGTGAMLGLHSSEGWFQQSWGDSLKEYHWDNLTSAASLVGMYDAESDSLGWAGLDSAGEAWKDLAHSVVPWEEWGERPGYVIGTALLNIGATVGGAALTATGVGAVVGVPLMAWRGAAILDGMGGSGRGGDSSGGGMPTTPANMPTFGGRDAPVVNIDTSGFAQAQKAEMTSSLDRLNTAINSGGSGGGGGGSSSSDSTSGGSGRSSQPGSSSDEAEPNRPRKPAASQEDTAAETRHSRESAEESSAERSDSGDTVETTTSRQREDEASEVAATTPNQDPRTQDAAESDRILRSVADSFTPEQRASYESGEQNLAARDPQNQQDSDSPQSREQVAASLDEIASDYPGWSSSFQDPESDMALAGARTGGGDSLEQAANRPMPGIHARADDIGAPGSHGDRMGNEPVGNNGTGRNDHNLQDRSPTASNKEHNPTPTKDDTPQDTPTPLRTGEEGSSRLRGSTADTPDARSGGPADPPASRGNEDLPPDRKGEGSSGSVGKNSDSSSSDSSQGQPGDKEFKKDADADTNSRKFEGKSRGEVSQEIAKAIGLKPDASYKDFAKKFTDFLNDKIANGKSEYFSEFYNKDGSRFRIQREVMGFKIPQLTSINGTPPWIAVKSLPDPDPPKYRLNGDREYFSSENSRHTDQKMDEHAENRKEAIRKDLTAEKQLREQKAKHKEYGENHPDVIAKDKEHAKLHADMTKKSEDYGEEGAEVAVRDLFDGKHSLTGKDGQPIKLPGIEKYYEGEDQVPFKVEGTPSAGNYQFDQIWPLDDGGILIVEAKSSQSTDLGERIIEVGGRLKRVSQGSPEYLEATLENMKERGRDKPVGNPNELKLAEMIEDARIAGKLHYAEVKNITPEQKQKHLGTPPATGEKHSGYSFGLFDIPKTRSSR